MLGHVLKQWPGFPSILLVPYYFYLVNINSMKGVLQSLRGNVQITWGTPRSNHATSSGVSPVSMLVFFTLAVFSVWLFTNTLDVLIQ